MPVKEWPVLFSSPMIRALLNTRIGSWPPEPIDPSQPCKGVTRRLSPRWLKVKAGDQLWVRENYFLDERNTKGKAPQEVIYDATPEWALDYEGKLIRVSYITGEPVPPNEARRSIDSNKFWHRKPSIHMPRWASRIQLECLEDTRAERLQEITEEEAQLEGVDAEHWVRIGGDTGTSYRMGFRRIWETLHTKPGETWSDNPTVYRVGPFRRIA